MAFFNTKFMKSQLPPEFHEEVKIVPKITLIREILLEYYNIPKEGVRIRELNRMINSCIKKDCAEFRISELSLSRNIIWRNYGYGGVSEETKQQKNIIIHKNTTLEHKEIRRIKEALRDKQGIEKYYILDSNNPIDQAILKRIRGNNENIYIRIEERKCRVLLSKRLSLRGVHSQKEKSKADSQIYNHIEARCIKQNRNWNDVVRELFCIHFNIKQIDESKQFKGCTMDLKATQPINM
jgi:hypothetical protein